jgi:hypothetical protein
VRLDWILVSEELAFSSYRTLPDRLSDHLGVVAEIELRGVSSFVEPEEQVSRRRQVRPRRTARAAHRVS